MEAAELIGGFWGGGCQEGTPSPCRPGPTARAELDSLSEATTRLHAISLGDAVSFGPGREPGAAAESSSIPPALPNTPDPFFNPHNPAHDDDIGFP